MPLIVEEVNLEKDFDELFQCELEGWRTPRSVIWELLNPVFGSGPSAEAEAFEAGKERQLQDTKSNPDNRWVKVTDTDTGKIVAAALWTLSRTNPYRGPPEKFDAPWWPAESDVRELISSLFERLTAYHSKMMSEAHAYLKMLFTHPAHRKRGAGKLLVQWGVQKADEMRVEAYVEASLLGKPVYEREGFIVVEAPDLDFDVPGSSEQRREFAERLRTGSLALMWRPLGGVYEAGKTVIPWEGKPRA